MMELSLHPSWRQSVPKPTGAVVDDVVVCKLEDTTTAERRNLTESDAATELSWTSTYTSSSATLSTQFLF